MLAFILPMHQPNVLQDVCDALRIQNPDLEAAIKVVSKAMKIELTAPQVLSCSAIS